MKYIHNFKATVFCNEEENEEAIQQALTDLFPFNLKKEKVKVERIVADGAKDNKIIILEIYIKKEHLINLFIKALLERLSKEQKQLLIQQVASRVDDACHFFIRFDKDRLINKQELFLTDKGSCFHLKCTIAAYPAKKLSAIKTVKQLLKK